MSVCSPSQIQHPAPAVSPKAGCPDCAQLGFENLHRWRVHKLSSQPVQVFNHPHSKEGFSCMSSFMCVLTKLIQSETSTILLLKEKTDPTHTQLQAYFHCLETSSLRMKLHMINNNNNNLLFLPMAYHCSKNFCIVLK